MANNLQLTIGKEYPVIRDGNNFRYLGFQTIKGRKRKPHTDKHIHKFIRESITSSNRLCISHLEIDNADIYLKEGRILIDNSGKYSSYFNYRNGGSS